MDKLNVSKVDDIENELVFEFIAAPEGVETEDDIREAIADVVKAAEAGETEIENNYLGVRVIVQHEIPKHTSNPPATDCYLLNYPNDAGVYCSCASWGPF